MSADPQPDIQFEIGHILLMDIIGHSKLLITDQRQQLQTLDEISATLAAISGNRSVMDWRCKHSMSVAETLA